MVKEFTQWPEFVIEDIDTLKALADARRIRILEQLVHAPHTAKEVAAKLEMQPSKIYYHINLLEKHELIQVVKTRIVSGIVEKHYQAVAKSYHPSRNLISTGEADSGHIESLILAALDKTRSDIVASFAKGISDMSTDAPQHKRLFAWSGLTFQTPEEYELFTDDLTQLFLKHQSDNAADPSITPTNKQAYSFYVAAFPIANDTIE